MTQKPRKTEPDDEGHEDEHWRRQEALQRLHMFHMRTDIPDQPIRGLSGFVQRSIHARGVSQKMEVVAVIHQRIDAGSEASGLDIFFIGGSRDFVAFRRRGMVAHARINVGWHVHEMSRRWREFLQTLRAGQRALGLQRSFNRVNVIMICAEMIRIAFQNRLENGDDFLGSFVRAAIPQPKLPRMQIHPTLRIERRRIEIIWIIGY